MAGVNFGIVFATTIDMRLEKYLILASLTMLLNSTRRS